MKPKIFKCGDCENVVEIVNAGTCDPACCGSTMVELKEKTEDVGHEKHVPVIEAAEGDVEVKIGSVPHPMEVGHYITWVEIISDNEVRRRPLEPGDKPQASFPAVGESAVTARAYCSIHGLWKS